ncbi:uncharacterized protein TNCV_3038901 [Trichonephila clavipes]|nr:uncharacterized protein TNCV_3038901 [Trichonephila clavipes]
MIRSRFYIFASTAVPLTAITVLPLQKSRGGGGVGSRDGELLARVPLMARSTIFWALHRSKRSTTIDSSIKEFSVRFSQIKELSETLKFIMYPDVTWFDKLNLPQFDWLEIEFEMQLIDF